VAEEEEEEHILEPGEAVHGLGADWSHLLEPFEHRVAQSAVHPHFARKRKLWNEPATRTDIP